MHVLMNFPLFFDVLLIIVFQGIPFKQFEQILFSFEQRKKSVFVYFNSKAVQV